MVEAGTLLQNRYLIQKQIGAGGMGTVYLATDQRFHSPVAIKQTIFEEADLQRAFEREAQLLNSLRHPALPHVIDYFTEGAAQFLVMEYFTGEDLSEILKQKGAFPLASVLRWADDLLDALCYLHSQKASVVHRDIKPQNLKLTPDGEIILLDFGLAKGKIGDESQISRTNSIFGYSRNYAPLEQIQGTGTDTRSDIYSLGATLYHLLTGKPPVDALTRATTFVNEQPDPLIPANTLNSLVPVEIAQILQQTLELKADRRPQTATILRESLRQAAAKVFQPDPEATHIHAGIKKAETTNIVGGNVVAPLPAHSIHAMRVPLATGNAPAEKESFSNDQVVFEKPDGNRVANSLRKYLSIATVILILGGAGFAAWYATQPTAGRSDSPINTSSSNAVANAASIKKTETTNANSRIEEKVEGKISGSNANTSFAGQKHLDSANKNSAVKTVADEQKLEEQPVDIEPPTIVVKSAPPTEELKKSREQEAEAEDSAPRSERERVNQADDADIGDDSPVADDKSKKRKKSDDSLDEDQPDGRERRAPDKRKKQKLPTLLGAPQR